MNGNHSLEQSSAVAVVSAPCMVPGAVGTQNQNQEPLALQGAEW